MRRSARHSSTSGEIPISRSFCTLCCVGLVLSSPAVAMYGTSVRCTKQALLRPEAQAHLARCLEERQRFDVAHRAADFDDRDVRLAARRRAAPRSMKAWISLVMCGMTCTVLPR